MRPTLPVRTLGGALLLALSLSAPAHAAEITRVVVPRLRTAGDVPERLGHSLEQLFAAELRKLEGVSVLTASDVTELLGFERQRQLAGCSEDESSCLAELAGALDAHDLITLELSQVGGRYTLSTKRFDARQFRLNEGFIKTVERRNGEEVLALIGAAAQTLYPSRLLKPGRTRGVDTAVAQVLNPPPLPRWVFIGTAAAAAGSLAAGGTFGWLAMDQQRRVNESLERTVTGAPIPGQEIRAGIALAERNALVANVLFACAGGLALAAAVEAPFTDWRDARSARIAFAPTAGGGLAVIGGSF